MTRHERKTIEKAVIAGIITVMLIGNTIFFFIESDNPVTELTIEEKNGERTSFDKIPYDHRATRADNPYASIHLHPIDAKDSKGGNPDHTNLDEDAPGDGAYENTGTDSVYAWIECRYGSPNIPLGSIIHNMTIYMGYYNDLEWNISASHVGLIWNSTSKGVEQGIINYTLTTSDKDEVYIITSDLPTASEFNDGICLRVNGYDINGQNDVLHLDYLYFAINYSIPDIVINEVMFNPSGPDDNAEWVEIHNKGLSPIDLTGWNITDNDGNSFSLGGAGTIPGGGYLVCHLAQSGTNSTTDVYGAIETEIVIRPNATVGKDTFLTSNDPPYNFGDNPDIIVENTSTSRNILIQFNLSNLPSNELITIAKVCLYRFSGNDNDATVGVYRMTQSWTETGATWNTYDGTNSWASGGGDFDGLEWDSITITGEALDWYSWDITGLIKSWKNGTYNNYGMIFKSMGGSVWKGFYSSDYIGDTNLTPKLVVEFSGYRNSMLNSSDSLALVDSKGNIVDYIAWGGDPGLGDDGAVLVSQWNDGDYIDTSLFLEAQTLGRDIESNDTDQPEDWENATGYADPFGVDRADTNGHSSGEINTNPVIGVPSITDVTANPATQYIDENVNITCNVVDLDGIDSVWVNVSIPGGGYFNYSMIQGPGDQWYNNSAYSTSGIHQYTIWANNTNNNWSCSSIFGFIISISQPTLSNPIVTPDSGYIDSWFNFTVSYSQPLNKGPDIITLNLSGPAGGIYTLIEVDASDTDYIDGKMFYYNVSGLTLGSYSFHFAANDTDGTWTKTGEIFQPSVINKIPSLSGWQINPALGYIDTGFNFTVTYTDLDGHAPDKTTVNITNFGTLDMIELDPFDIDCTDGKLYYLNLSGFQNSTLYSFHFAANDTIGDWTETAELSGPQVLNSAPTLFFPDVYPLSGFSSTFFNFTVNYIDLDNHPPDNITLNLSGPSGGIFDITEVNISDMDFTDGKLYYYNISGLSVGSYSFHFAAQDGLGFWAQETAETGGPDVLPRSATLTVFNEVVEYSDNAFLNATLIGNGTPIAGEDVAFFIDVNQNGLYEPEELIGDATTIVDGSVSLIFSAYLIPRSYDYVAVYNGSGGLIVEDVEALLTINPKPATLTAHDCTAEEGEVLALNATLTDDDGNPVAYEQIDLLLDKNKNGIYEGSELIGSKTTSAAGVFSIAFTVNLIPGNYDIWARYMGPGNYTVSEIEGILTVQNTGNNPPVILGVVPNQVKQEDSLPWTLDLTSFEADLENSGVDLKWYLTGIDTALYSVTGQNSSDDVFTFIPQENAFGNDEVTLWLVDGSGDRDSQILWINITPVNDLPYFAPLPPNIYVHYDDPSSQEDDPTPWNYAFYVHDIETPIENMIITTSEPTTDSGDGYVQVNDLKVTFHYPQSRVGESILVTLTLNDGTDTAQTTIIVNVTDDWVPELVYELPDIIIEENTTLYNVFDLDDYFTDKDRDSLFFSSGYFHLIVDISPDNTVDITALEHWTGIELVTFRAKDPTGAIVEDTITVTIVPVNDGPKISSAPNLNVHFDYSYTFDFSPYISDPDNSASELLLWTSESTDHIWLQQNNNLGIVVNYPISMNGSTIPVIIFVSDGVETASQEILITVSDNFPPELLYKLPDVSFKEDTFLEDAILLSYYFLDVDGDALYFSNGSTFINITINEDFTVDFGAPENWHGFEKVTFRATDPTGSIAEDTILIVVVPVNDPPTLDSIPNQVKNEGDQWVLDLSQYIDDVDNEVSELIITVESQVGNGHVTLTGNILVFEYPEGVHNDIVTVTVSDGDLETQRSFTVSLKSSTPVAPSIWDMIPWPWMFLILLTSVGCALAIYRKKSKYLVHEAFLIHEKGLPIAHASSAESSELEDVVVSGMFTAVQDFINDVFSGRTHDDGWKLDEMKFGENKILIERTDDLFLAAIFEGNGKKLGNRLRKILEEINKEYGRQLSDWNGDMTQLTGISAAILPLIPIRLPEHAELKQKSVEDQSVIDKGEFEDPPPEREDMEVGDEGEQENDMKDAEEAHKGKPGVEEIIEVADEEEQENDMEDAHEEKPEVEEVIEVVDEGEQENDMEDAEETPIENPEVEEIIEVADEGEQKIDMEDSEEVYEDKPEMEEDMEVGDEGEQENDMEDAEEAHKGKPGVEEVEVYECPVCKALIGAEDTKCSGCGVEFTENDESESESTEKNEDNEMKKPNEVGENNGN